MALIQAQLIEQAALEGIQDGLFIASIAHRFMQGLIMENLGINSVFHYQSLHKSGFYADKHDGRILENSDRYTECLLRLPLFYELSLDQCQYIINAIQDFDFDK